jgi:hypothetical protein
MYKSHTLDYMCHICLIGSKPRLEVVVVVVVVGGGGAATEATFLAARFSETAENATSFQALTVSDIFVC